MLLHDLTGGEDARKAKAFQAFAVVGLGLAALWMVLYLGEKAAKRKSVL